MRSSERDVYIFIYKDRQRDRDINGYISKLRWTWDNRGGDGGEGGHQALGVEVGGGAPVGRVVWWQATARLG